MGPKASWRLPACLQPGPGPGPGFTTKGGWTFLFLAPLEPTWSQLTCGAHHRRLHAGLCCTSSKRWEGASPNSRSGSGVGERGRWKDCQAGLLC